jgi:hypothetical protein
MDVSKADDSIDNSAHISGSYTVEKYTTSFVYPISSNCIIIRLDKLFS